MAAIFTIIRSFDKANINYNFKSIIIFQTKIDEQIDGQKNESSDENVEIIKGFVF